MRVARRLVPRITPDGSVAPEALKLASGSFLFLAVQETLEHSLELNRAAVPSFTSSSWVVLAVALGIFAVVVACVARALSALVNVARRAQPGRVRPVGSRRPGGLAEISNRSRPLAVHGGLRAPPVAA